MALTLSLFESAWNATTSPKTVVVTGAANGDYLFAFAGGDDFEPGSNTTAASVSTTVGTTSAWTESAKEVAGTSADWILAGWAQVTATADVTVSVSRTQSGTPGNWGFYVLRAEGSSGVGNVASSLTSSATQAVSLSVSANSGVGFLAVDWDAAAAGSVWTPTGGVTSVERATHTQYTAAAAYWSAEAAGTRNYGATGMSGTKIRCVAVEILEGAAGPPPEGPQNSDAMHFMGPSWY